MKTTNEYSFKKYSQTFPRFFRLEKTKLKKIFSEALIEHVGSSSVEGLSGKGIIDIIVAVPRRELTKSIVILQRAGYDYRISGGNFERKFFQKIISHAGKNRRIHIHLTYVRSRTWNSMISIRDYLKTHTAVAKEYAKVKKQAVKHAKGDGKKYREYKSVFLKKLEKTVMKKF